MTSSTLNIVWVVVLQFLLVQSQICQAAEMHSLLQAIDISLTGSDKAYDLKDQLAIRRMEVARAEHFFDTKMVPLTSIGFTQGTGSQQLGMELRKETPLGTSISYGLVGNRIDDSTGYSVENSTHARAYVKVSQGLFRRWGEQYNLTDLNRAQLLAKGEEILVERERQALILSTVRNYYDLVLATQLLSQSEKSLERSREHLSSAISRQQVGLVSKVDVYRAELAMLDAEIALENQTRALQRSDDLYKELLRIESTDYVRVADKIVKMSPVIPEGWEKTVWLTRLDWQAHRVQMKVGKLAIFKAEQDLNPDIGLSATVEQKGAGDSVEEALELDQTNWAIQLQLLSPLDTFDEESILARTKMDRAKQRRQEAALRRKIIRNSRNAFLDLFSAEKKHQLSYKRLEQSGRALDLAKTRYEKGISNNLDLLDAEAAYSGAEVDIARSLATYNVAAVAFAHSLGVLDRNWIEMALNGDTVR